jgi:hypothetical protein
MSNVSIEPEIVIWSFHPRCGPMALAEAAGRRWSGKPVTSAGEDS